MAACQCEERNKTVAERNWVVVQREWAQSRYRYNIPLPSDTSAVQCLTCQAKWRTKARYIDDLRDAEE